jgi:hypothetical protein
VAEAAADHEVRAAGKARGLIGGRTLGECRQRCYPGKEERAENEQL